MKLRKLEIIGFKSFVDRTILKFDHDVTGVVGPNGCGKSNIVDAIRWCMGEQSAKHLRGRSMEDVIFNGSESRGPHGFAEVTLTFDNTDGLTPIEYREYPEISVTRKLFRNGDSEYLINKTQVRLKDVTDLFLGTGAGTKAYSTIEQGKVGLIVSSKPEERRLLIEEAAGITKYKSKRKQAERKIELTQQNLLRIGDILSELEKNITILKRQAQKAERYLAYRAEVEDKIVHEAAHRYLELVATQKYFEAALETSTHHSNEARTICLQNETKLEALRIHALESEQNFEAAQTAHFGAENEVRALEGDIARAHDQQVALRTRAIDATQELNGLAQERDRLEVERLRFELDYETFKNEERTVSESLAMDEGQLQEVTLRQQEFDRRLEDLRRKISSLEARIASAETALKGYERRRVEMQNRREKLAFEQDDLGTREREVDAQVVEHEHTEREVLHSKEEAHARHSELDERLTQYRKELVETEKQLDDQKSELQKKRSRLQALLEVQSRLEGVGAGARAVLQKRDVGVVAMVADLIEVPESLMQALAAVLNHDLQAIVVTTQAKAIELGEWLRNEKSGRAVFVSREEMGSNNYAQNLSINQDSENILGSLFDLVHVNADDRSWAHRLLQDVLVVRTASVAKELHLRWQNEPKNRAPRAIVTLDGDVFMNDGRIMLGSSEQVAVGMLESKHEVRELAQLVSKLDTIVSELVARHQELRLRLNETQHSLDEVRKAEHKAELALLTAQNNVRSARAELERIQLRAQQIESEAEELSTQMAEAEDEFATAREALSSDREERELLQQQYQDVQQEGDSHREELEARRHVLTERKVQAASVREKKKSVEGTLERLTRSVHELSERKIRLETELLANQKKNDEWAQILAQKTALLESAQTNLTQCREQLTQVRDVYDQIRSTMAIHESELKITRQKADSVEQERVTHEMRCRELALEIRSLLDGVRERFRGLNLVRVLGDYHLREIPNEAHRVRIQELHELIDRLGAVNLEAKQEYDDALKRFDHYQIQKTDLEMAIDDLNQAIEQMDRESRRLFKETFDAVNQNFQNLFPIMFRGGKASLVMTEPEDLLETGIDILAQPPGKRIGNIELMSGGEKALTAVSLIFAIFQIRPSPFCILDEVDAPLDEANVARYNDIIRTMTDRSQFILITHIKKTMQMVDVLYGVTMPEPGVSALTSVDLTTIDKKIAASTKKVSVVATA